MASQLQLVCDIMKALEKQGLTHLNVRQMNAVIEAANVVCDALAQPHVPATPGMGWEAWCRCDDRGASSEYMAFVLAPLAVSQSQNQFGFPTTT